MNNADTASSHNVHRHAWRVYSYEVQRTEPLCKTYLPSANRTGRPARSSSRSGRVRLGLAGVLCCVTTSGLAQSGEVWRTSGQFHLSGSFTSAITWSENIGQWSRFDEIERATPALLQTQTVSFVLRPNSSRLDQLLDLITTAEAGQAGYDAVHMAARIRPPARPTQMTLAEIFAWIEATPGQPHAIGRYQFIPSTLARLTASEGLSEGERFTPALQSRLAKVLIQDAGYRAFEAGQMGRSEMMDRLAAIWAGLPLENGRSVYHGFAGNRATISRAKFVSGMEAIYGQE